jgi:hypothetical protein
MHHPHYPRKRAAMPDPSPALRAANERLLALRAQLARQRSAEAGHPQPESTQIPAETAVAPPPDTHHALPDSLPAHLGWDSPAVTTALRARQQSETAVSPDTQAPHSSQPPSALAGHDPNSSQPPANAQLSTGKCQLSTANQPLSSLQQAQGRSFCPLPSSFQIYPSLALALLRGQQVAAGRLWLLLRLLDSEGRGWLDRADIEAAFADPDSPTHFCTARYLRQLLAEGEGLFWQREGSDKVWLRGQAKVAAALGLRKLRGRAVELPLGVLLGPIGDLRAHLYASFHSSREELAPPISRASLRDLSGASPRTQQAYETRAEVDVQPCLALGSVVTVTSSQENAWQHGQAAFTFTDHQGKQGAAGGRYQAHRLPNRYAGPHPQVGGRPQRLNRQLADLCHKGCAGNDQPAAARRYYADGAAAGRVWLRRQGRVLVYWQTGGDLANGRQPRVCFWYMLGTGAV